MQNSDKYIDNNTIEINTGGFPLLMDDTNEKKYKDEVTGSKRKNNNEFPRIRKNKLLTSSMEIYNKKQKICNEIKDVINPTFKIDNMLYKKTKTLKGIIY